MKYAKALKRILSIILTISLISFTLPLSPMAQETASFGLSGEIISFNSLTEVIKNKVVPLGTSISQLNLPDMLDVTVQTVERTNQPASPSNAEKSDMEEFVLLETEASIPVTWEALQEYDGDTAGQYHFSPVLGSSYVMHGEPPIITVTVIEEQSGNWIMAFEELAQEITEQSVPLGTEQSQLNLPYTLTAEVNQETVQIEVIWESAPKFEGGVGKYIFIPMFDKGYRLAKGVEVPEIVVTVGPVGLMMASLHTGDFTVDEGTEGVDYSYESNILTIQTGKQIRISTGGTATSDTIKVAKGVNAQIILDGLNIDVSDTAGACALDMSEAGTSRLTLAAGSINDLKSGQFMPGIFVPAGNKLTLDGDGTLTAYGGIQWPGIGRNENWNIEILSGVIKAEGGEFSGGIGGSDNAKGGKLIIRGGIVEGIGNKGAGIGGGYNGSGGDITINGGTITAIDKVGGPGVGKGTGYYGEEGTITINGGTIKTESQLIAKNSEGVSVLWLKIPLPDSVTGIDTVIVEGKDYNISTLHENDNAIYIYVDPLSEKLEIKDSEGAVHNYNMFSVPEGFIKVIGSELTVSENGNYSYCNPFLYYFQEDRYIPTDHSDAISSTVLTIKAGVTATIEIYHLSVNQIVLEDDANVTLILKGEGDYKNFIRRGIAASETTSITIDGDGELMIKGNGDSAGIGGTDLKAGGNITINGGTVTAIREGRYSAAGIGGGRGGAGGNIIINGGTVIAAGGWGAGIGGGSAGASGNITINGGVVTATGDGGAGIGGGFNGAGENITITGGTVTANGFGSEGIGSGYYKTGGTVKITGGSVKASSIQAPPKDNNGIRVYLGKLENQSGVTSVSVDSVPYRIDKNHDGDDSLYLYLPHTEEGTENHSVDIAANGDIKRYKATWDGSKFIFDSGTGQESPEDTEISLHISDSIYGQENPAIITATVADGSIMARSLQQSINMVDFYLENAQVPFASKSVSGGTAVAELPIADWNAGDYRITAKYNGSFGGKASTNTQVLTIAKASQSALSIDKVQDKKYGELPIQLTVTGGSGTGEVSYTVVSGPGVVSESGLLTITGVGDIVVTATKAADHNYNPSAVSQPRTIAIGKADQDSITVEPVNEKTYGDSPIQLTTTGGSGTGKVFYTVVSGPGIVLESGMVTITGAGNIVVTASKAADEKYNKSQDSEPQIIVVGKKYVAGVDQTYEVVKNNEHTYIFDLTTLLPGISPPEQYKSVVYNVSSVTNNDGVLASLPPVGMINGTTLSLEVADVALKDKEAQIVISFTSDNHTIGNALITVKTVEKIPVDITNVFMNGGVYNGSAYAYGGTPVFTPNSGGSPVTVTSCDTLYESTDGRGYYSSAAPVEAGTYRLTLSVPKDNSQYTGSTSYLFNISKRPVTVRAKDFNIKKGEPLPTPTVSYTGFIGADSQENALAEQATPKLNIPDANTVGTSVIDFQNYAVLNGTIGVNYILNHVNGVMTINSGGSGSTGDSSNDRSISGTTQYLDVKNSNTSNIPIRAVMPLSGTTPFDISESMVKKVIEKGLGEGKDKGRQNDGIAVVFESNATDLSSLTVRFKTEAITRLIKAEVKYMEVDTRLFRFKLDTQAIRELEAQSKGEVILSVQPRINLPASVKEIIGNRPVFDITLKEEGGRLVSNFKKGIITLGIAYTPAMRDTGNLYAIYVPESGEPQFLKNSSYGNGWMIFNRNSLSAYGIGYKSPGLDFNDTINHKAKDDIDFTVSRGLINGISETVFSPDTNITQGTFLMALGKLFDADVSGYKTSSFYDVSLSSEQIPYIQWAVQNNIVKEPEEGGFLSDAGITREQMAVMLQNYAKVTGCNLPVVHHGTVFADNEEISSWAAEAVKVIGQAGIMDGKNNNLFAPQGNVTRADACSILRRFMELVIDQDTKEREIEDLKNIVCDVNQSQVDEEECLSNEVYRYDAKTGSISMVSDEEMQQGMHLEM